MTYLSGSGGYTARVAQPIYSLEAIAQQPIMYHLSHASSPATKPIHFYGAAVDYGGKQEQHYAQLPHIDAFTPEPFLNPIRPLARFVGETSEIADFIEQAFATTTGNELPADVSIQVLSLEEFRTMHEHFGGFWSEGLQGFSINNKGFGQSLVFIRQGPLDRVMVTIGHELGHLQSFSLAKKHDEEAKAFAFEMAWIRALHEENIANLRESININPMLPAQNGLHDVAFHFVQKEMRRGKMGLQIFRQLVQQEVSVHGLLCS